MAIIYQHQDKIIGCNIVTSEEKNKKENPKKYQTKTYSLGDGTKLSRSTSKGRKEANKS